MNSSVWQDFISYLFRTTTIEIPSEFGSRVKKCKNILNKDYSNIVTTIFDFAVNVGDVDFKIETDNKNLTEILEEWRVTLNDGFDGTIPPGIKELAKEYFKERWTSSLLIMYISGWKKVNGLLLPTKIWFLDGEGINIRGNASTLGKYTYWTKVKKVWKKLPLNREKSNILVQKPFARWYDKYPVPYLIRKGTLVSCLIKETLKENQGKVLDEMIPYLNILKKGGPELLARGIDYDDKKLKEVGGRLKAYLEKKKQAKEAGVYVAPYDTELQEFIPDLAKVFRREIFQELDRDILASLGLIEIIEGVGTTRREAILNPAPFKEEVKQAVEDFKAMVTSLIALIMDKNKKKHRKWSKANIKITSAPIKGFFTNEMLIYFRSLYDRGLLDKQSAVEIPTGLDYRTIKERRTRETEAGDDETMYPPVIMNREGQGIDIPFEEPEEEVKRKKPEKVKQEKEIESQSQVVCEVCGFAFDYLSVREEEMGYAKCPLCDSVLDQEGTVYFIGSADPERTLEATLADLVQAPVDITERYIRIKQKDPKLFQKNSFRTITLGKGIKAIVARLKGQKKTTIQSYLFDKNLWTVKRAKDWIKEHKKKK